MRTAALLMFAALFVPAAELKLASDGRPLRLVVEKGGFLSGKKHLFDFPAYTGTVSYDAANPGSTAVLLTIRAGEFRLLDDWVSEKDRKKIIEFTHSREMLDTSKHPTFEFRATNAQPEPDGSFRMTGQLTIRGITKPVTLSVKPRQEAGGLVVEGRAVFPMTAFGLKPPSAVLGTIRTKDEMTLTFEVLAR